MKKSIKHYTIFGILFSLILGTLLHFIFQWTGQAPAAGFFSAVNESTWEHLKLLFYPCFLFFLFEHFKTRADFTGLFTCRIIGLMLGLLVIVAGFYTYSGIIGRSFLVIDILLFAAGVLTAYLWSTKNYLARTYNKTNSLPIVCLLFVFLFLFILFTYLPPHIALFMDPVSFTYGIPSPLLTGLV